MVSILPSVIPDISLPSTDPTPLVEDVLSNPHSQPNGLSKTVAEIHGELVPDLHLSLWDLFYRTAIRFPEREAVVSLWQGQDLNALRPEENEASSQAVGCLRWTYHNLHKKTNQLAAELKDMNCQPGMQIAAVLWNSAEYTLFYWVAAKLGMTFIPIDPRNLQETRAMIASVHPTVLVVQDAQIAASIDEWSETSGINIRIQTQDALKQGWIDLTSLLHKGATRADSPSAIANTADTTLHEFGADNEHAALIVFTSGTGGTAKGCHHTNRAINSQTWPYDANNPPGVTDRWLVHTPVSHIFAVNNISRAFREGDAVIFPSKAFDVDSTVRALVEEQATIMSATPTLVKALVANAKFPKDSSRLNLSIVSIAGTVITKADIDLCRQELGSKHVIQAYGMTEGAPVISWTRVDPMLAADGYHEGIGKVLPGAAIRICQPQSHNVVERGEIGELHIGGTSVVSKYVNVAAAASETFYRDDAGDWLVTGDRAMVDEEGVVHLYGRYKDLIIRGGHNIDPLKIEIALGSIPGLQAQVVGVPDEVAGQLPIAVVKLPENVSKKDIVSEVAKLGPEYMLKDVYTLEQLGIDRMPLTSLGKVKKQVLRDLVNKFLLSEKNALSVSEEEKALPDDTLVKDLTAAWEEVTGIQPGLTDSVSSFADSITILRYCDHVYRTLNLRLYLPDLVSCDTIEKQAELLRRKAEGPKILRPELTASLLPTYKVNLQTQRDDRSQSLNQVSVHNASFGVQDDIQNTLVRVGLEGSQVETVLELRDSLLRMVAGQRPQAYHIRMAFRVCGTPRENIRAGIEKALVYNPTLRTVLFQPPDHRSQHAVIEASSQLSQALIKDVEVITEDEARSIWEDGSVESHRNDFMFGAKIMHLQDTDDHILSMTFNHSVVDAVFLYEFHQDLDNLIHDGDAKIAAKTPYALFTDLYWHYENSRPAQLSIQYQARRLRGISRFQEALWPVPKAPGWMISRDAGSHHAEAREQIRDQVWEGRWKDVEKDFQFPRKGRIVRMSNAKKLRQSRGIAPVITTTSALALFNAQKTGSGRAIFNTWESGRSWPFIPSWMEQMLPSAMSIGGPTVEWILQMFEICKDETVASFLDRMGREQEETKIHEHAPWQKVVEELREEGQVAVEASYRQSFVWDMSISMMGAASVRGNMKCMEPVARCDWADW